MSSHALGAGAALSALSLFPHTCLRRHETKAPMSAIVSGSRLRVFPYRRAVSRWLGRRGLSSEIDADLFLKFAAASAGPHSQRRSPHQSQSKSQSRDRKGAKGDPISFSDWLDRQNSFSGLDLDSSLTVSKPPTQSAQSTAPLLSSPSLSVPSVETKRTLSFRRLFRGNSGGSPSSSSSASSTLPMFPSIPRNRIVLVTTPTLLQEAHDTLINESAIGFDSEWKPRFRVFDPPTRGPHLVQCATADRVFLFSLVDTVHEDMKRSTIHVLNAILASDSIQKVGFGLLADRQQLQENCAITLRSVVDLTQVLHHYAIQEAMRTRFNRVRTVRNGSDSDSDSDSSDSRKSGPPMDSHLWGKGEMVGVRKGVRLVLQQEFIKSKQISKSDWGMPMTSLSARQILYAANDAWAPLLIYRRWQEMSQSGFSSIEQPNPSQTQ